MKFTQNLTRAAMLLLFAVLTSVGARADEAEDLSTPLTIEATEDGTTVTFIVDAVATNGVEYSSNGGTTWEPIAAGGTGSITLNAMQTVQFRGNNAAYAPDYYASYYSHIECDKLCYVYGNMMSLITKTNFATTKELTAAFTFFALFKGNTNITNHSSQKLMLPATTLTSDCYEAMFYGCSELKEAPVLPATTVAEYCYYGMFNGCTSLKSVTCYAITGPSSATQNWLYDVASEGTFVMADGTDRWQTDSYHGIPTGWKTTSPMASTPLTLEATEDGTTVTFTLTSRVTGDVEYSVNNGAWTTYTSGAEIHLSKNNKVQFRGKNATYGPTGYDYYSNIQCNKNCYVYGNVMSLIDDEDFPTAKKLTGSENFVSLFADNTHIINHQSKKLVLPATMLTYACYAEMFANCTGLTAAPALPATTLKEDCYVYMFAGCTSLTKAPALPATTLAAACYAGMFAGCTSLTEAPLLPATMLTYACYAEMFAGCENLSSVTCYATDINANNCTTDWLANVAATGTFNKAADMENWQIDSSDGIPNGWTSEVDIKSMPLTIEAVAEGGATVSFENVVEFRTYMNGTWSEWAEYDGPVNLGQNEKVQYRNNTAASFYGLTISCSNKCHVYGNIMSLVSKDGFATATEVYGEAYFLGLFKRNTNIDIPVKDNKPQLVLPATTLSSGCYVAMFEGCTGLTNAPDLPATTLAEWCYSQMFNGCTGLTKAPDLPAPTLAPYCYLEMFSNCTNLTKAPDLPAPTLVPSCYQKMFAGCKKLNSITCLATDISDNADTYYWVYDVAPTGTFTMAAGMEDWEINSYHGIPEGWTVKVSAEGNGYDVEDMAAGTYATFYFDDDRTLSEADEELQFYTVSSVGTDEVVLTEIEGQEVPAKTPFIIYNAGTVAKTFSLVPTTLTPATPLAVAPEFKGTAEEKEMPASTASKNYYVLRNNAFAWVKSAGTIPANRCWLELGSNAARQLNIVFGDATGIRPTPNPSLNGGEWYDLQGRKMVRGTSSNSTLRKGIYIQNGQKVVK